MADDPLEIQRALRRASEQNLKQAQAAYEQLMDLVAKAMGAWIDAMPANPMAAGLKDVQGRVLEYAKDNAESAFTFAGKIGKAQTLQDVSALQTQFAQDRMQALAAQTQQLFSLFEETFQKSERGGEAATRSNPIVAGFGIDGFEDVEDRNPPDRTPQGDPMSDQSLPESIDGLPNICGREDLIAEAMARSGPFYLPESGIDFGRIRSAFAIALHMHQPLVPAGGGDLPTAAVIGNLKHMMDNPGAGDNHNAAVFAWCYKRMGEFIPQLIGEGKQPRAMLDYSGELLHGLRAMGLDDVFDALKRITLDPAYRGAVEWLGTAWGHAVAPSTPAQDFRLHVRAWQHHFAGIFGLDALSRVRGFSPPEMALPNHPDVAYEFVRTLKECGYRWVLVQEHTVENPDGSGLRGPHLPHLLVARNSRGETQSIVAIVKTQGSDSKLVGQMQPYYEAKGLSRTDLGGHSAPPLVTQIADGENGGVMMNDFPPKYMDVMREASGSDCPAVNVSEYLEYLDAIGVRQEDFPHIQPIMQKRIWERFLEPAGPEALEKVIEDLRKEDGSFHMEGGSWTNNLSWVRGYESVLGPMEEASALFAEKTRGVPASDPRYRNALFYLLTTQTSCYRYWGSGIWTDYGRELARRTTDILKYDF
ncbi:MAG: phasin family protein [Rhodomicrobium sp.]